MDQVNISEVYKLATVIFFNSLRLKCDEPTAARLASEALQSYQMALVEFLHGADPDRVEYERIISVAMKHNQRQTK